MIDLLKISVKTNASKAHHFRLQEQKHLGRARTFNIISKREEVETEEQKQDREKSEKFYDIYQNLRHRRVHELRVRARHELLAYAFLRGFDYEEVEIFAYFSPDFDLIERIIFEYIEGEDPRVVKQQYEEWVQLAQAHLKREKEVKE